MLSSLTWKTLVRKEINRSSHQRCSVRKRVLRNFAKFTRKHPCQSLFVNKSAGLRPEALFKKWLWHRCFPVNFVTFLRTPFSQNVFWRLLLHKKTKKVYILFKSIIFVKKTCFVFILVRWQNSDQEKKLFLRFSFFEGTPRS